MSSRPKVTLDGNEAAAYVAHATSEVISIYPITPSSNMGEWADQWSSEGRPNIWGTIPNVIEMQSEAGAAGAYHGALQGGALGTTFTASQGLLLMIPNMFKIAGELTSTVMHVSARTLATHALSIFGDHSDVMATRSTGWSMLCSSSVQEVMDMALIAQMATLEGRVPILHFFDGFRTSHEVMKVEQISYDDMRALVDSELVQEHRARGLTPEYPELRGSAQNPDTFFQSREACSPYFANMPGIVQSAMNRFAERVGRKYHLFDYYGAPDATRVIVIMGSGVYVAREAVEHAAAAGEKIGVLAVRFFRPFDVSSFLNALPATVRSIAVLDRCKEPGAPGEPLYMDVVEALSGFERGSAISVIGGRYGLSSKDFTPAMVRAVFDEMNKLSPKHGFTVGIDDNVSFSSLAFDPHYVTEDPKCVRCLFYGLGADGTVGANKNSIKIIGEDTDNYAQGYFEYDSKKSGGITTSHLRFGPNPIYASYFISKANFIACHQFSFLERYDMLKNALDGATFLLNSPYGKDEVWDKLPLAVQKQVIEKKIKLYTIDAVTIAKETGMGGRINTIMQTCFFAISGVLPKDIAIDAIKKSIKKTYGRKGDEVVRKNIDAVDSTLANLFEVKVPGEATSAFDKRDAVASGSPEFVRTVLGPMMINEGDALKVSDMPDDGSYPTATSQYEKRNVAIDIPSWNPGTCIQCGKCALVCPHATIRAKVYDAGLLKDAPETFKSADANWKNFSGKKYTVQIAPEDCIGCSLCVQNCPAKDKNEPGKKAINMTSQMELREAERANWEFFLGIPETDRTLLNHGAVKDVQLLRPLFEFSGACGGCGETPYLKLLSSLFGDRALIANATGCSSIYGGNLPTTPWAVNSEGRGPAWSNSLFEDCAEFGLGFRLTLDKHKEYAQELLAKLSGEVGAELAREIMESAQATEKEIAEQRERVDILKEKLTWIDSPEAEELLSVADALVKKSVWAIGGDGWAYDIGYGGLDHVLASGRNINILVLDTEVYSNTGGQMSKSTPRGAIAKFAAGGKRQGKKDLALMAMAYGSVYVGKVAMGANDAHTVKTFLEAEAYDGPSIIIAYSHCIAHGIEMHRGLEQQKKAVDSGHWILMRYNPALTAEGKNPLSIDSKAPTLPLADYIYNEVRYKALQKSAPEEAAALLAEEEKELKLKWRYYQHLAAMDYSEQS
ncbi:MAG: pyruvate:ferredoxin (flavodoxin) oxidoreductase [Synergistaceae bacterium]|jgi:pyruvate-ferredoxin/flavodoxin oxidoreductase|nr:pyruvate:ferredoxin (flavodoxin) oxidoreductase [Synergistaceae bacterium]